MSLAMRQVPFIRFVAVGNGRHEADLYLLFSSLMGSSKKSSRPPTHSHNMHTPNQSCTDINTHVCMHPDSQKPEHFLLCLSTVFTQTESYSPSPIRQHGFEICRRCQYSTIWCLYTDYNIHTL